MSKAEGKYIVIEFTQDLSGVTGGSNTSAFTYTGQEYLYVPGGPLVNKTYAVENVAHPPKIILYTESFTLGSLVDVVSGSGALALGVA